MPNKEHSFRVSLDEWDSEKRQWKFALLDHPYVDLVAILDKKTDALEKIPDNYWEIEKKNNVSRISWFGSSIPSSPMALVKLNPAWPVQIKAALITAAVALIGGGAGIINTLTADSKQTVEESFAQVTNRAIGERGALPQNLEKLYRYTTRIPK